MCGEAYLQSARIAEQCPHLAPATTLTQQHEQQGGACPGFYPNREPFLDVIRMHRASVNNITTSGSDKAAPHIDFKSLIAASKTVWDEALAHGEKHGYRNAQVTVLAPTGTIGFMMDCDTTGIEPDLALVKYKKLVGGGMIKIVNNTVPSALFKLGYTTDQANAIVSYIDATGTIEGAPAHQGRAPARLRLLLQAVEGHAHHPLHGTHPHDGRRAALHLRSHLEDRQHAQRRHRRTRSPTPTSSPGARASRQSPSIATAPKEAQPLNVSDGQKAKDTLKPSQAQSTVAHRKITNRCRASGRTGPARSAARRPSSSARRARFHHPQIQSIGGHEGYITVGLYQDGMPGEIFITWPRKVPPSAA